MNFKWNSEDVRLKQYHPCNNILGCLQATEQHPKQISTRRSMERISTDKQHTIQITISKDNKDF